MAIRSAFKKIMFYFSGNGRVSARFRGRILYESKKCIGCQACFRNCPSKAIAFHEKGKIDFDMGKCMHCGLCRDVCPVKCIRYTGKFMYASRNKKDLKNLVD